MTEKEWAESVNLRAVRCCETCRHAYGVPEALYCNNPKTMEAVNESWMGPFVDAGQLCDWYEPEEKR